ncbi:VOC family protein [Kocuria rhizophila]|uniref:VOC family protein n=1 Tax=Kocuria TaxID=57493 RepID=UPI000750131C|nr:VOC family protein [Kocuria rhizophila]WIW68511.1 VOC family protein [Kocuria sp. ChxB]KUP26699.1 glyoxalase [Kocuria rhizophila]MCR4524836.1 VOC family protein [Kocuria rhizophila]MCT1916060.1 VOC family protein [Kocuria rhizophila]WSQ05220.1 VOC family protein [Kocuria rhizophila]
MAVLDHAALHVEDLDAVCAFYTTHLGATQGAGYHNPRTGLRTYFLSFEDGGRLEVMTRPDHDRPRDEFALGYHHVAFHLGSRAAVDACVQRLRDAGTEPVDGPRVTGDGYYEAVVLDPEGHRVEVVG